MIKNGVAKPACVFHVVLPWFAPGVPSYWAANTVRKFNGEGEATTEKGSFTLNTPGGQIFIGKIKYP